MAKSQLPNSLTTLRSAFTFAKTQGRNLDGLSRAIFLIKNLPHKEQITEALRAKMKDKNIVTCVDGAYVKDGKVLLLKRAIEPFKDRWSLVGGHVEGKETLDEALKREFKEETNLEVEIGEPLGERLEETFDRIKRIVTFEVTSAKGDLRLNSENTEYGWFDHIPPNSVFDYAKYLKK